MKLIIMWFRIFVESVEDGPNHCMYLDFALIYIIVSQVYKNIQHNNKNKIDLLFKVNHLNLELIPWVYSTMLHPLQDGCVLLGSAPFLPELCLFEVEIRKKLLTF